MLIVSPLKVADVCAAAGPDTANAAATRSSFLIVSIPVLLAQLGHSDRSNFADICFRFLDTAPIQLPGTSCRSHRNVPGRYNGLHAIAEPFGRCSIKIATLPSAPSGSYAAVRIVESRGD